MSLVYVICAGILVALAQLCIKAKVNQQGKEEILMATRYFISAFIAFLAYPFTNHSYTMNFSAICLGVIGGMLQGVLMWKTRKLFAIAPANAYSNDIRGSILKTSAL